MEIDKKRLYVLDMGSKPVSDISFGLYFYTPSFVSLITVFHHVDSMVWRANQLNCLPLSKWICSKPQSTKSTVEEYELLEDALFESQFCPFELWSESTRILKDIGTTFALWLTSDKNIDYGYINRKYIQTPELTTLQNLVNYYASSSLMLVYAKGLHYNVTLVEYEFSITKIKTLSYQRVMRSTLLTPPLSVLYTPEIEDNSGNITDDEVILLSSEEDLVFE